MSQLINNNLIQMQRKQEFKETAHTNEKLSSFIIKSVPQLKDLLEKHMTSLKNPNNKQLFGFMCQIQVKEALQAKFPNYLSLYDAFQDFSKKWKSPVHMRGAFKYLPVLYCLFWDSSHIEEGKSPRWNKLRDLQKNLVEEYEEEVQRELQRRRNSNTSSFLSMPINAMPSQEEDVVDIIPLNMPLFSIPDQNQLVNSMNYSEVQNHFLQLNLDQNSNKQFINKEFESYQVLTLGTFHRNEQNERQEQRAQNNLPSRYVFVPLDTLSISNQEDNNWTTHFCHDQ